MLLISYSKKFAFCQSKDWKLITLKNIKLARYAGFCHGVKRAVETTKKIKSENANKNIWILGELIHNAHVINELERLGIHTVHNLSDCTDGICIIRTHGMAPEKIEEIKNCGLETVDLTCPDVKKVQQKAVELAKEGFPVLILGKGEHPEVIAIKANAQQYTDKVFVIPDINALEEISETIKQEKKAGIVIQTTQKIELLQEVVSKLLSMTGELKIFNTICKSTAMRQNEAKKLAQTSDLMVVVGSKNSANTTHLAEILKKITPTLLIETANDIDVADPTIINAKNIGVTAGASTPENLINEVIEKLKKI